MDARETFPFRLKEARRQAGMTQTRLAKVVGADNVQISRYESGAIMPSVDTLVRLADALECSIDYLLGRSDMLQIGALSTTDLEVEEQHLIQALREYDIRTALLLLSSYVPLRLDRGAMNEVDVKKMQLRRGKRVEQNRAWYAGSLERFGAGAGLTDPTTADNQDGTTD